MKVLKLLSLFIFIAMITSCSSVKVATDYDKEADFDKYNTFAFYKPGIDEAKISDLDKKRVLRAIDLELKAKGFTKSENPDFLISFFTESREEINVYQNNYGYTWGWSPYYYGQQSTVTSNTEGTLYIDVIDRETNQLIWQGIGKGYLETDSDKKTERISEIVHEIIAQYPPQEEDKK
ncbi:MAG: DUF4136 domain-containing protein [Psychroflexus sp.]|uniref:DUF4136 domain-containing protein n=1 Tax=Psychroflexus sp. S27 TaxID=1982757 RepID=UPI000C2AA670|nr:DUF4136 domain-containing protein [Psychroflexus sp. S27]PJX24493.1 hypothetical protein CAP47_03100 [Psychroflexus sp. S27]